MHQAGTIRVGAIENAGPNTLISYLRNAGNAATQIDIAVAFVTAAGLDSVLYLLKKTAAHGHVRLLTGLYQGFTEPKALRTLLREQRETDGRLAVQLSVHRHFHWKTYFLVGKTTANVIIGSSNLTDDGLRQTGEFNAVLSLRKVSKQFLNLHGVFDRHWRSKSTPLSEEVLGRYEEWRVSVEIPNVNRHVPISKILASAPKPKPERLKDRMFWHVCIDGHLSDETEALLKETTDWDKRGYLYFAGWRALDSGDRVVLFDLTNKSVAVFEIKETTRTPQRTPDGIHFAAYRRVRGIPRRKLGPKRWKSLRSVGLIRLKADAYLIRKLSPKRFERFVQNLRESTM
jgi:HKD family nuclease